MPRSRRGKGDARGQVTGGHTQGRGKNWLDPTSLGDWTQFGRRQGLRRQCGRDTVPEDGIKNQLSAAGRGWGDFTFFLLYFLLKIYIHIYYL